MPVLAGTGYGTAIAVEIARGAEKAGRRRPAAAAALSGPFRAGRPCRARRGRLRAPTKLGVIVYNRDNAIAARPIRSRASAERCPNLVGYKDGVGDIELMTRVYSQLGDRLTYVGGLPTAETFALPYLDMGVTTYSSAVFNFVPEFAHRLLRRGARRDARDDRCRR